MILPLKHGDHLDIARGLEPLNSALQEEKAILMAHALAKAVVEFVH